MIFMAYEHDAVLRFRLPVSLLQNKIPPLEPAAVEFLVSHEPDCGEDSAYGMQFRSLQGRSQWEFYDLLCAAWVIVACPAR